MKIELPKRKRGAWPPDTLNQLSAGRLEHKRPSLLLVSFSPSRVTVIFLSEKAYVNRTV